MSRSVTVAVAYIMSVTNLNWNDALRVVRTGRQIANPNKGFQTQLQDFELFKLEEERLRLKERFPSLALIDLDRENCDIALNSYELMLARKSICEGTCKKGEKCPTGVCRIEHTAALRRKTSQSSNLSLNSSGSGSSPRSCPSSPRHGKLLVSNSSVVNLHGEDELMELRDVVAGPSSFSRSSSISSSSNRCFSGPRGLHTYTNSAPSSLRNSRVDLASTSSSSNSNRPSSAGSVINVVGKKPSDVLERSSSRTSLTSISSLSRGNNPSGKPPPSPKRSIKRYNVN